MKLQKYAFFVVVLLATIVSSAKAADQFISFSKQEGAVSLFANGETPRIQVDQNDYPGVLRAVNSLISDIKASTGCVVSTENGDVKIIVGTLDKSSLIKELVKKKVIDIKELKGKTEKYIIKVSNGQIIIAGSDKRGTTYGIYELSRQLGVSP